MGERASFRRVAHADLAVLTSVVLPALYAFRRILWLGRDAPPTPQPVLDPSAPRG